MINAMQISTQVIQFRWEKEKVCEKKQLNRTTIEKQMVNQKPRP